MAAVSPDRLIERALAEPGARRFPSAGPVDLLAVGKAASAMADAWLRQQPPPGRGLVIGTHRGTADLGGLEWRQGGHPVPTAASVAAGRDALALAAGVRPDRCLVVLLSGGASAVMAVPLGGLSLEDKRATVSALLAAGADIGQLNTVRKHLSAVKGGRLAAACAGTTWTLAVSDVVGDDPAVIGSGPTVPDPTTFADALDVIASFRIGARLPSAVRSHLEAGARGEVEESVKPGDPRLGRAEWRRVGGRHEAMEGAKREAEARGYHPLVVAEPVVGEARRAAVAHLAGLAAAIERCRRPACVISSGETTVKVTGGGRGGRNQEFVLAAVDGLAALGPHAFIASAGTDGIDGPTDAAGALADTGTLRRAAAAGLGDPADYLARNDSYHFFAPLGDLLVTGPTDTNVGDVQVVLLP